MFKLMTGQTLARQALQLVNEYQTHAEAQAAMKSNIASGCPWCMVIIGPDGRSLDVYQSGFAQFRRRSTNDGKSRWEERD